MDDPHQLAITAFPAAFGRYQLLGPLGRGGMGYVYRGIMRGIGGFTKMVAVKVFHRHLSYDPEIAPLFMNEARLGGILSHPNIVETLDVGQHEGRLFMAMEYVNGPTLRALIQRCRHHHLPLPPDVAIEIIRQVCDGLHYAHTATDHEGKPLRLVHRDLKPSNIMLDSHGQVKVADFGVARAESNLSRTLSSGILKGTVHYMSPEQAWGLRDLDHRSDLFAVGLILFELLTLEPLYTAKTPETQLRMAQDCVVEPRLALLGEDPFQQAAREVLARALAKKREDRYRSAAELAKSLLERRRFLSERTDFRSWLADTETFEATEVARGIPSLGSSASGGSEAKEPDFEPTGTECLSQDSLEISLYSDVGEAGTKVGDDGTHVSNGGRRHTGATTRLEGALTQSTAAQLTATQSTAAQSTATQSTAAQPTATRPTPADLPESDSALTAFSLKGTEITPRTVSLRDPDAEETCIDPGLSAEDRPESPPFQRRAGWRTPLVILVVGTAAIAAWIFFSPPRPGSFEATGEKNLASNVGGEHTGASQNPRGEAGAFQAGPVNEGAVGLEEAGGQVAGTSGIAGASGPPGGGGAGNGAASAQGGPQDGAGAGNGAASAQGGPPGGSGAAKGAASAQGGQPGGGGAAKGVVSAQVGQPGGAGAAKGAASVQGGQKSVAGAEASVAKTSGTAAAMAPATSSGIGKLSLNSVPVATLALDGAALGESPANNLELPTGWHTVVYRLESGEQLETTVKVLEGAQHGCVAFFKQNKVICKQY